MRRKTRQNFCLLCLSVSVLTNVFMEHNIGTISYLLSCQWRMGICLANFHSFFFHMLCLQGLESYNGIVQSVQRMFQTGSGIVQSFYGGLQSFNGVLQPNCGILQAYCRAVIRL